MEAVRPQVSSRDLCVIQRNLVLVNGLPQSLADKALLGSPQFFGQYGEIKDLQIKTQPTKSQGKVCYLVFVTYSNPIEATLAILAVNKMKVNYKTINCSFGV